jgi:hypothetical protein
VRQASVPSAYSFESDLSFRDAVKRFNAMDDWVRKPNLEGKWLVRDNDRLGDYLSWYDYDAADPSIVKTICLFFDTRPRQVTLSVSRRRDTAAGEGDPARVWGEHQAYVLSELLPSIGARNVMPSDFEK